MSAKSCCIVMGLIVLAFPAALRSEPMNGQIVIDPDHPQWLKRHGGGHLFICGPGDPEGFLYLGKRRDDGTRDGPQEKRIRKLIKHGGNCIYMQVVRGGKKVRGGDGENDHSPWVDSDPEKGLNEDILDQWEKWFTLMDQNEIVIYLFFYDDGGSMPEDWARGQVPSPEERAFISAIVNRFKHHKNLIWVLAEEAEEGGRTKAHAQKLAKIVRAADDYDHLIGCHHQSSTNFKFYEEGGALNHFSMQANTSDLDRVHAAAVQARKKAEAADDGYMVIYSENTAKKASHTWRGFNWAAAMGGVQVMNIGNDIAGASETNLKQLRFLQGFFEATDFYTMSPHDELASHGTKWVLADPLRSYIAYASDLGDDQRIGLKGRFRGVWDLLWADCVSGKRVAQQGVKVNAENPSWAPPPGFGKEIAVWVRLAEAGADQ